MSITAIVTAALAAVLVVAADGPLFAAPCPALIQQANQQMAAMDQNTEQVQTAKGLLAEAERLHKAGNHAESVAKAREALAALKKADRGSRPTTPTGSPETIRAAQWLFMLDDVYLPERGTARGLARSARTIAKRTCRVEGSCRPTLPQVPVIRLPTVRAVSSCRNASGTPDRYLRSASPGRTCPIRNYVQK